MRLCTYCVCAMQRLQSNINSRLFDQRKQFDYMPKGIIVIYEIPLARRKKSPAAVRREVSQPSASTSSGAVFEEVISILTASIYSTDPRYSGPEAAGRPDTVAGVVVAEDLY